MQPTELPGTVSPQIKREGEIKDVLENFVKNWNDKETAIRIKPIENAAKKVTEKYFELLESAVRQYLNKNSYSNKFKVAAGSEIAVMYTLPIVIDDPNHTVMDKRRVNAVFAIQLAMSLLYMIYFEEANEIPEEKASNEALSKIINNHNIWLSYLNVNNISASPTLINSNFWEAYFYASTGISPY